MSKIESIEISSNKGKEVSLDLPLFSLTKGDTTSKTRGGFKVNNNNKIDNTIVKKLLDYTDSKGVMYAYSYALSDFLTSLDMKHMIDSNAFKSMTGATTVHSNLKDSMESCYFMLESMAKVYSEGFNESHNYYAYCLLGGSMILGDFDKNINYLGYLQIVDEGFVKENNLYEIHKYPTVYMASLYATHSYLEEHRITSTATYVEVLPMFVGLAEMILKVCLYNVNFTRELLTTNLNIDRETVNNLDTTQLLAINNYLFSNILNLEFAQEEPVLDISHYSVTELNKNTSNSGFYKVTIPLNSIVNQSTVQLNDYSIRELFNLYRKPFKESSDALSYIFTRPDESIKDYYNELDLISNRLAEIKVSGDSQKQVTKEEYDMANNLHTLTSLFETVRYKRYKEVQRIKELESKDFTSFKNLLPSEVIVGIPDAFENVKSIMNKPLGDILGENSDELQNNTRESLYELVEMFGTPEACEETYRQYIAFKTGSGIYSGRGVSLQVKLMEMFYESR